jgi:hypothetical protein
MRAANARPADMRSADMCGPAAVPAKPAEMSTAAVSAKAMAPAVPAATVSAATVSAAVPAPTAATSVCFECDKRHDEQQHRGHASAGRQHRPARLGSPHPRGQLSLGIRPKTKSL